jgi:hypothetical protein
MKTSAEKMYKIIKNVEDNDCIFHPVILAKEIEKVKINKIYNFFSYIINPIKKKFTIT